MLHECDLQTGTIVVSHYKLTLDICFCKKRIMRVKKLCGWRAWWLSRRASDSGARDRGFETYLLRVVTLA